MAHDVFISYSSHDKPAADAVCAVLERDGIRCWIAPRDILPSAEWAGAIVDAIKGARVFIVVFSRHSNASTQVAREVERAISHGIAIVPFRIEEVTPSASMEYYLGTPHWMNAFPPPMDRHFGTLAQTVAALLEKTIAAPPPPKARQRLPGMIPALSASVLLVAAAAAAMMLWPRHPSPLACDRPADYAETDQSKLTSFVYYSPETLDKAQNRRVWSRPTPDEWIEQAPGKTHYFSVVGRIKLARCDGTVVARQEDPKLQLFLSDKSCPLHALEFRRTNTGCDWTALSAMEEVQ